MREQLTAVLHCYIQCVLLEQYTVFIHTMYMYMYMNNKTTTIKETQSTQSNDTRDNSFFSKKHELGLESTTLCSLDESATELQCTCTKAAQMEGPEYPNTQCNARQGVSITPPSIGKVCVLCCDYRVWLQCLLQEMVEEGQLLQRRWTANVTDVHLTQQLYGDRPTGKVLGREMACLEDPGQEDEQWRVVGGRGRSGLVVS